MKVKKINISELTEKLSEENSAVSGLPHPTTNKGGHEYKNHIEEPDNKATLRQKITRKKSAGNGYKIDWISTTVDSDYVSDVDYVFPTVLQALNYSFDEFEEVPPRYFYNMGYSLGGYVNFYYNDFNKTTHTGSIERPLVVFTGQGMTDVYNRNGSDIMRVLRILAEYGATPSRLDIAYDDYHGVLSLSKIEKKLNKGEYRSRAKYFRIIKGKDDSDEKGFTIYIGNPRSKDKKGTVYARLYNKYAQAIEENILLAELPQKTKFWNRYELSYSKKKATEIFNDLINRKNVDLSYKETFKKVIEFVDPDPTQANKARWELTRWYQAFLLVNEKMTFSNHDKDATFGDVLAWLESSVLSSLILVKEVVEKNGLDFDLLLKNAMKYKEEYTIKEEEPKKRKRLRDESLKLSETLVVGTVKEFLFNRDFNIKYEDNEELEKERDIRDFKINTLVNSAKKRKGK